MEKRILSACLNSRGSYETVRTELDQDGGFARAFSPIAKVTAELLEDFYSRDPSAESCSRDALIDRLKTKGYSPHHTEAIADFCSGLDGTVSVPNLVHDLRQHRKNRIGDKIAGMLANRESSGELDELISAYQSLGEDSETSESTDDVYNDIGAGELLDRHFSGDRTIPLGLEKLNELCDGGARRGHQILIFARPEVGKTLFTIDMVVSGFLRAGKRVLYLGNEDPMPDILLRAVGRLTRRNRDEIRADPEGTSKLARARNYGLLTGVSATPGNFKFIDALVQKHVPDVIVIDQLRNIDVGDDNRVTALEKAAIGARNLGKARGLVVVSLTQAGDSASGKQFLDLSDIDGSKTGIPGAVDLAVGIGASEDDLKYGFRTIGLPKNKLGGRHEYFQTRFDTKTGVVETIQ